MTGDAVHRWTGVDEVMGGRRPAGVTCSWLIIHVLVAWTCVNTWSVSETEPGARVSWAVTWSPGNELHHLAVDPVSGKVSLA